MNYKLKKSGDPPVTIQYKEEIEAILDKNRPTLNPKSCIDFSNSPLRKEEDLNIQESLTEKNQMETSCVIPKIGRRYKNKYENNDADIDLDDQTAIRCDVLNNLSNSLNSLHKKQNQVNQVNQDDLEFPEFEYNE
ncbi:hypothetical protein C1645_818774 [Glomus cerebriforme]|uniref:Uncharacterized protein n=1 Tax=Glomus cerebriforme TaxID=658196 RepID=A0A397TC87_9GLOM|nr:hypothetical protein C1645_818774 [Glomus cerebriforme]